MTDPTLPPELTASSEHFLDMVLETVPNIIYVYDLVEHRNVFSNREITDMLGYTPEQVQSYGERLFVETIHPEDLGAVVAHHGALRDTEQGVSLELEYRMKDATGAWRWLRSRDTPFERDDTGLVRTILGSAEDITARKGAEGSLALFQRFAEAATEGFGMATLDGRIHYANPALTKMMGAQDIEQIRGAPFPRFYTEASQLRIAQEVIPNVMAKGSWQGELELTTLGGRRVSTYEQFFLVRDDDGHPVFLADVVSDITVQRRDQADLRRHRDRLEELVSERTEALRREKDFVEAIQASLPGVFYVLDSQGDFVRWNTRFEEVVGRSAQEMAGSNAFELFEGAHREHIAARIGQVFVDGEATAEADMQPAAGPGIPYLFTGRLAQLDGVPHLVGMGLDISERRAADREREELNLELQRKNEELEQVVYVTSHDLRSPLVNVQGFGKELERGVRELMSILEEAELSPERRAQAHTIVQEDIHESLAFITSSACKMEGLLAGLLQLSRAGRRESNRELVDLEELLRELLRSFEFVLQERGIELELGPLPPCMADREQLSQVFANLVDNAIKYLDPTRPGRIRVHGVRRDGRVELCIEDNGVGIDPRHQGRIFDLFHRLDPGGTQGEGIGLTIVRKILHKNQGSVRLESELGQGTCFFVDLPAVEGSR